MIPIVMYMGMDIDMESVHHLVGMYISRVLVVKVKVVNEIITTTKIKKMNPFQTFKA